MIHDFVLLIMNILLCYYHNVLEIYIYLNFDHMTKSIGLEESQPHSMEIELVVWPTETISIARNGKT
jgi:hypothetical protein